jgi:hypothetical protein
VYLNITQLPSFNVHTRLQCDPGGGGGITSAIIVISRGAFSMGCQTLSETWMGSVII